MTQPVDEIVVGDADEPPDDSPAVASRWSVETATLAITFAFAALMGYDNWRTGIGWESTGPQPGYFPFYMSIILGGACLYGLGREWWLRKKAADEPFVRRNQFKRVLQVFVPTVVFVEATQWVGLYVASFLLITGFMLLIGRIKAWKSFAVGLVFTVTMFVTFEIAFDVIMPKGPLERLLGY